ncbi:MAG TPA: hypothetical protein VFU99_07310 [Gaiellaceae bacterium]|nr:hypothetical protein [Gaiellaceae bacterium]
MVELRIQEGGLQRVGRPGWARLVRRPLVLLAVTLLCCAAYLAGIWYGTQGGITCTTSQQGVIQCGDHAGTPLPAEPAPAAPRESPT